MQASEREALVANARELATSFDTVTLNLGGTTRAGDMLRALCAEVERLTRELEAGDAALANLRHAASATRRELTAEVKRLREDAARLDYMDAQRNWTRWMGRDTGDGYTMWPVSGNDSFRAAIDAARTTGGHP